MHSLASPRSFSLLSVGMTVVQRVLNPVIEAKVAKAA